MKFRGADALGYVTGKRSNVTALDVDTTDEGVLADALNRHGQAAIIVRTASGKFHALYRYNGERRQIRPWPELPIDLLGDNGYVLAPPSKLEKGGYEIIHGRLDDLGQLRPMAKAPVIAPVNAPPVDGRRSLRGMREHDGRNNALFLAMGPVARRIHQASGTHEEVLDIARRHNAQCAQPMEGDEVTRIVESVWGMTLEGRNIIGLPDAFCLTREHLTLEPDVFKLLAFLRAHQGLHAHFMCANGLAEREEFRWDRRRLASARHTLIELGYLIPVRQAGRGHPALFRWGTY